PPETENGQRAAKAGEHQAATTPTALDGRENSLLSKAANCLTLSETNQYQQLWMLAAYLDGPPETEKMAQRRKVG
ncbi:MAG TPA: hypothetical protein VM487_05575, partial [Phycisphaerae bacterium]|nr:hypothetical protein [Phycisphaerae bacterium]